MFSLLNIFLALPNITIQPVSIAIKAGDLNVTAVSCSAFGVGPIHYQWEKFHSYDNSWINPSQRVVNISSPNLIFSIITEYDEGIYRCIITNDDGSVISNNATVNVYSKRSFM